MHGVSRRIGDFEVTALSDGTMAASLGLLSGIDITEAGEIQRSAGVNAPGNLHIYAYLVRGRGRVVLIDAGTGGVNNVGGEILKNLLASGVTPSDVDTVLLTHAHPDHIGGLLNTRGEAVYPRARVYLHPQEAAYWQDDKRMAHASERVQRNFSRVRQTLAVYGSRVHLLDDTPVIEGIYPIPLPGHTPGHTGYKIEAPDGGLLVWGDIVHFPHIQTARPDVTIAFDLQPELAQASRKAILAQAVAEQWLVAGMHLSGTGFARVMPDADGYRIVYIAE